MTQLTSGDPQTGYDWDNAHISALTSNRPALNPEQPLGELLYVARRLAGSVRADPALESDETLFPFIREWRWREAPSLFNSSSLSFAVRDCRWFDARTFDKNQSGPTFSNRIEAVLDDLGVLASFNDNAVSHVTNLVSQLHQNAATHGRREDGVSKAYDFAGVCFRVGSGSDLAGTEYRSLKQEIAELGYTDERILEIIVHDIGPGIAAHYAASKRGERPISLKLVEQSASEYWWLTEAFEKYASSRGNHLEWMVNHSVFRPGLGLYSVLSSLRALGAFMDVRSGALRTFRFISRSQNFSSKKTTLDPELKYARAHKAAGTLIRVLVPLQAPGR